MIALAVVVFVIVWLLVTSRDDSTSRRGPQPTSLEELRTLAASSDRPIYWAGPLPGREYEVTRTAKGSVYVRYLPEGTKAGDPQPNFLTVATYPQRDGFKAVSASAKRRNSVKRALPDGGLAVYGKNRPSSVFFSYPRARYQVEVYDPSPKRSLNLVTSGKIIPVR